MTLLLLFGCPQVATPVSPPTGEPLVETGEVDCPAGPTRLAVPVRPAPTEDWELLGWRTLAHDGEATVAGPFEVRSVEGGFALRATGPGTGTLQLHGDCPRTVELVEQSEPTRWGRDHPTLGVSPVEVVQTGVRVALEGRLDPDLAGRTVDLFVVPSRDREDWLDRSLVDLRGAPDTLTVDGTLWIPLDPGPSALDLVVDVDRDGLLGPGDRLVGLEGPGITVLPDLAAEGPFAHATREEPTWRVDFPTDLAGPAPLVVISPGIGQDHASWVQLGAHLASWGLVVLAHDSQADVGIEAAADSTLAALGTFLADPGPLDVDAGRTVLVGHSRGGEGVLRVVERLRQGEPAVVDVDDLALVVPVAPTVYLDPALETPAGSVPFHLFAGSADTDVSGGVFDPVALGDCAACQWFRTLQGATGEAGVTYLHGATHTDFADQGQDPGAGGPLIGRQATHDVLSSVLLARIRSVLGEEPGWDELLWRADLSLGSPGVVQRLHRPAETVWLEDFASHPEPGRSSTDTEVSWTVEQLVEGALDDGDYTFQWDPADPMNGMTYAHGDPDPPRGVVFGWSGPATWQLAVDLDLTAHRAVLLELAQITQHPDNAGDLVLEVVFTDAHGEQAVLSTEPYAPIAAPYDRQGGWTNAFETVRIPVADVLASNPGLDLRAVRSVALQLGGGSPTGRLALGRVGVVPLRAASPP